MHLYCNLKSLEKNNRSRKREVDGGKGVLKEFVAPASIVGDCTRIEEEYGPSWCQETARGL
jgi:hypothetical protein